MGGSSTGQAAIGEVQAQAKSEEEAFQQLYQRFVQTQRQADEAP